MLTSDEGEHVISPIELIIALIDGQLGIYTLNTPPEIFPCVHACFKRKNILLFEGIQMKVDGLWS